jgi:hypothetical protein
MKLQDAIDHVEGSFTCDLGASWRWADLLMTKPYQTLQLDLDVPGELSPEDAEHRLVSRFIVNMSRLKQDAGFRASDKPKLFWRWKDRVRLVDGDIVSRFYIDGNPGYTQGNPSRPKGRPTVGQIRLAA